MGSVPFGVQCGNVPSLHEFLGYWADSGILGFRPCWCPSRSLRLPYLDVLKFTLPYLPLDFIRVSSLRPTYLHPFIRPFTYSLFRWVCRLGTTCGIRCCGPRGGTKVRMEQKSQSKFLPWPG